MKGALPTLQTSLTHPELPPCPRHLRSGILFRFLSVAGTWGKFLLLWEVRIRCSVRLSRLIGGWGTFGEFGKMGLGFMGSFSG